MSFAANSPFSFPQAKSISIPVSAKIVFVADMFLVDYPLGGAELTSEAIIESAPFEVFKLHSKDVTLDLLEMGHDKFWIFGNFAGLNSQLIPSIIANMKYSILEFDYKYCRYRSPEKHVEIEKSVCNCQNEYSGKMISAFFCGAKSIWWMSEKQLEKYTTIFPGIEDVENTVLSSVFDDNFFAAIKLLREKYKTVQRKSWIVCGSPSWIKGTDNAVEWCKINNKEYEIVWGLPYDQMLEKIASAEGFVFLPNGSDTCPRQVIEAKLLGCKLELNDNVQHANEEWFTTNDMLDTEAYLYMARSRFWNGIRHNMEFRPKISGYVTTFNCIKQEYPFTQCIESLLGFCDEVCVVDGGSSDGTIEKLSELTKNDSRIKMRIHARDWNDSRFAVFDGAQKAEARAMCTGDFCWQSDSDEIVHEDDYEKIKNLALNFPKEVDLICLPVVEFWGNSTKTRIDISVWKWRMSRNKSEITHGIPVDLRRYDQDGKLFAAMGTDGCDMINTLDGSRIPHATFYTPQVEVARQQALLGSQEQLKQVEEWFNAVVENIPTVYHYSWMDIARKIRLYRDYWSSHWHALYNIAIEDTPESNMFFDKSWSDVSEEDIIMKAHELSKTGGHIFHAKYRGEVTPHITIKHTQPKVMQCE